jgi:hypothetical protein
VTRVWPFLLSIRCIPDARCLEERRDGQDGQDGRDERDERDERRAEAGQPTEPCILSILFFILSSVLEVL